MRLLGVNCCLLPKGFGFGVLGLAFWVLGFGFWVSGLAFWVLGFGFWVWRFGFRVLGFGFRVLGFGSLNCPAAVDNQGGAGNHIRVGAGQV